MLHHKRLRPPGHDYPPDEWSVIEKSFRPEFMAQMEAVLALGNGYVGFAGLRDYDGKLSFRPQKPPEVQAVLRFPITWHGRMLDIEIGPEATTYSLRKGGDLIIRHDDEVITLTEANSTINRPTLQPRMVPVEADHPR